MKKFRVGIIGCGRISSLYKQAFLKMPEQVQVVFVVDKILDRAKAFAQCFEGCKYSDKIEDLLIQDLDCVHILTPHFLHKQHTIQCLEAGFHVLCEKPIATTLRDAQAMIECAKKNHRQLGIIFQNRYIDGIQHIRKLLQDGTLGAITGAWSVLAWHRPPSYYECDWKGHWATEGGGVVIDQAIHSLDLVRYLMNCDVKSIDGHISRRALTNIEVEDEADALITYENGARHAFFACNYFTQNSPIRIELSCENGTALLVQNTVTIHLKDQEPYIITPKSDTAEICSYWGTAHKYQIKDFYQKLENGEAVPTDPCDAAKTLAIVLGIYRSAQEQRSIDFNELFSNTDMEEFRYDF